MNRSNTAYILRTVFMAVLLATLVVAESGFWTAVAIAFVYFLVEGLGIRFSRQEHGGG